MQLVSTFLSSIVARMTGLLDEKREQGQTLVEYALIIALISLLVIGLAAILSPALTDVFNDIANALGGS